MLSDFVLPSIKANGGVDICAGKPWSDRIDGEQSMLWLFDNFFVVLTFNAC